MEMVEHQVKSELDDITLQFFASLEQLGELQLLLANEMENGFFMMSRSRYKMGVKSVDIGCFDVNKLHAIYRVDSHNDHLLLFKAEPSEIESNDTGEKNASLRHRVVSSDVSRTNDDTSDLSREIEKMAIGSDRSEILAKKASHTSVLTKNDPLNFFGILVPQSLRDCQSTFAKAIQLLVDIANEKTTLCRLQARYGDLIGRLNEEHI